jgi:hypothetical protein
MSRNLPSGMVAKLTEGRVEIFHAIELQFSTPIYLWTGIGDKTLTPNGGTANTYVGTGSLLQIGEATEVIDMAAQGITVSLSGLDSSILSAALSENYQGNLAKIYFGIVGVSEMAEVFSGYMDVMTISEEASGSTISLNLESRLIDLERPRVARYTKASHQAISGNASDTFFNFITDIADKPIEWK